MADSDQHFRNWLDEITEQVDAAARAAGEAAAEEVRATAIVAALNTSRRLQTKIATDSIKQAHLFETENDDRTEKIPNSLVVIEEKNQHKEDQKLPNSMRNVRFTTDCENDDASINLLSSRRHMVDTNARRQQVSSYCDVATRNYSYDPRNYPYFYPPHDVHSAFSTPLVNSFNFVDQQNHPFALHPPQTISFDNIKAKVERIKNQVKDVFSTKK